MSERPRPKKAASKRTPRAGQQSRGAAASEDGPSKDRTNVRRGLIEQEIFDQATRLFAERGFAGTNFQDIADAVGLTRPALYHYVSSKDDLLARLVAETTQDAATTIDEITHRDDLDPVEKIRSITAMNVVRQGEHRERFRLIVRSEANLPETAAETHFASRRAVLRSLTTVIEEGVAAGVFRPLDPRVAALGILGMTNWVAWWFHPSRGDDLEAISRELADLAVAGLTAGADHRGPIDGPATAIKSIRADLARLEQMLD